MTLTPIAKKDRPARIMLVEDNPGDVILTQRAFKHCKMANELAVATNAEDALSMLRKDAPYTKQSTPDLILLDLNLPRMSGTELLAHIKNDTSLQHIPVIMLSSSSAEQDVLKSYNLHANGYIVKPPSLDDFQDIIEKVEAFWFTVTVRPDETGNIESDGSNE